MKNIFNAQNLWGIDFGGTKIEGVILKSLSEPEVIFRRRLQTEGEKGYNHMLGQIKKLYSMMVLEAGHGPSIIGIGSPGTYIPNLGTMKNCNLTAINGENFKQDIEEMLGTEILLANDANCFALAEATLGAVSDQYPEAKVVFGVILGTGVGGGVVINGEVLNGRHGIGGEWGHNFLYPGEGKLCYCGKTGCNEQIFSGPALEEFYFQRSGKAKKLKEIASLIQIDQDARFTIKRLTEGFGKALSVVVNILDPDVIVLGGGVSHIEEVYTESLPVLDAMIFNHGFDAPIIKAKLGDSAGVFGAALLTANSK